MQVAFELFSKYASNIDELEISTDSSTCLISEFTKAENLLVVYKDKANKDSIAINIANLGKYY